MFNKYVTRLFLVLCLILVSATSLKAAGIAKPGLKEEAELQTFIGEVEREKKISQTLDSFYRYMPSSKVDAQSGKVGLTEAGAQYSCAFRVFDKLPVEFLFKQEYIGINNSTVVKLPAHLVGVSMGIETTMPFFNFDKTYFRVGVYPSFFEDDWTFDSSSFRIPSRLFIIKQPSEKLTYVAGVAVFPDFENVAWPILGLIYKPNDKLTFNLIPDRPNISYAVNDKVTLFTEAGFSNGEFEVDKDNVKNTKLEYKETHLGAGIKYKLNKYIESSLTAGGMFNRRLQYKESLGKVKIDNGAYAEFRLQIAM